MFSGMLRHSSSKIQFILETFLPTFFDVDEAEHERFVASVGPCQFVKFGDEFFF